ncbi:MAG: hypothetical protein H6981_07220 [Gammaproteobacteria bacterium]|nr:hypothetical protein [Gammaproteobacteria bacterium]
MTTKTYYWEHKTDESRYLRSANAAKMAAVVHAQGGEVGVIVDRGGDSPLVVVAVEKARSVKLTAAALVSAGRATV